MNNITNKLHKFLFPSKHKNNLVSLEIIDVQKKNNEDLQGSVLRLSHDSARLREDIELVKAARDKHFNDLKAARQEIIEFKFAPKLSMEEIMRINIGSDPIDFSGADPKNGMIPHFMDINDKNTQTKYLTQLYQISQMDAWHAMVKFFIDDTANHGFRSADEKQITIARATVNGICLLRNQVQVAVDDWQETHKKEEDFDKFEAGSGVT